MDDSRADVPLSADSLGDSVEVVEYDPEAGVYHVSADLSHPEPFAYVVVSVVAALTGRDPVTMEPLHDTVDVDAVDALLASSAGVTVRFEYAGCAVTASGDGEIAIRVIDGDHTVEAGS